MKTFKQLIIGDIFYYVYTDYRGEDKPNVTQITVRKIEKNEDYLMINNKNSYVSNSGYNFKINDCDSNQIADSDNGLNKKEHVFHATKKQLKNVSKKAT